MSLSAPPLAVGRQPFLDHLRAALTALVLFHHAALTYGAEGGWYWRDRPAGSSPSLGLFCAVNQAFFMGLFFLIAGSLTPASYERHGPGAFIRERLLRLGVPTLFFGFVLSPVTNALARANSIEAFWTRALRIDFHAGPLWFAVALLLFTLAYVAWRAIEPPAPVRIAHPHAALLAAALATGAAAFAIRLVMPVGTTIWDLQFGYFASYAVLFAAGIYLRRLDQVTPRLALPWLLLSPITLILLIAQFRRPGPHNFSGGWTLDAATYAFWEPFFAWGIILGLLWLFNHHLNHPVPWGAFLARRAFATYIIHPPILVAIARTLQPWDAGPWTKTLTTGTLTCAACVAVSSLALRIPAIRRVV